MMKELTVKIVRVIVYEGTEAALNEVMERSLQEGRCPFGTKQGYTIHITTVRDDRPKGLEHLRKLPPEALDLLVEAFAGDPVALDLIQDAAARGG